MSFEKKAMDLDWELPEGHLPGALFVTAHELAYVVYFAQHFLATGKGPNDYGSGNHEVAQREIGRVYYQNDLEEEACGLHRRQHGPSLPSCSHYSGRSPVS